MPKLTYTVAGEKRSVEVTDSASIGRLPENQVPLPDETGASRRHCQILKISGGYELADLGSTNGTKVNGQKVKRHKLKDGDTIQIGETSIRWSEGSGAAAEDDVVLEGDVALEEPAGAPGAKAAGTTSSEQCFLVFAGGPRDGERIPLEKKRITFGRNAKNTFTFADDMGVSGYHCEVTREGGAYVLRDLGSTNGTLVDGEQVTEIALQHGNRVRIGAQRLVFVDTTISDFEKAMASVDDLGSEWGLLRAEMDMSRVQHARRSQMVAIGGVLVLLAGLAYVAIANPAIISGARKEPTPIERNAVPDFSFETRTATWGPVPGSPAIGRYAETNDGAAAEPGQGFYVVSREGGAGRGAAVALSGEKHSIQVNPEVGYAFGAKVRTKGGALAGVRVTWLNHEHVAVGESATDLSEASDWTEVRAAVAPPADAATARVELVNAGGGTAAFDDVFFAPAASRPAPVSVASGNVSFTVTPDGQATLRSGNAVLLRDIVVLGGAARADSTEPSKRSDRAGSRKSVSVAGPKISGQAWDAARGKWAEFSYSLGAEGERNAVLDVQTLGEDAALVAILPKEFVAEGLAVKTEDGRYFRMSDARAVDKVRSVQFGDRNPFEVSAGDGQTFRFLLFRSGDQWNVAFGGPAPFTVRVDTDAGAIRKVVEDLQSASRDAVLSKRYGDAIRLLRELLARLPQGSPLQQDAADRLAKLEKDGQDELRAVTEGRDAAIEFQDDPELERLKGRAQSLSQHYAGHAVGEAGAKEIVAIDAALEKRRLVLHERAAAPMLEKAKDFEAQKDVAVARALYHSIVAAYPQTAAAAEARRRLENLPTAGN